MPWGGKPFRSKTTFALIAVTRGSKGGGFVGFLTFYEDKENKIGGGVPKRKEEKDCYTGVGERRRRKAKHRTYGESKIPTEGREKGGVRLAMGGNAYLG